MTIKKSLILCILAGFCGAVLIVMKFAVIAIYLPDGLILAGMISGVVSLIVGLVKVFQYIRNL